MRRSIAILNPAVLLSILIALGAYMIVKKQSAEALPNLQVPMTPERIARGKYVYVLSDCDGCHSVRDWTRFGGPVAESHRGQGVEFPREVGRGRRIVSANITTDNETGIGTWPDSLKIRAIREGIADDGRQLDPMMPHRFRQMSDGDVQSLVAYLNTLAPIRNELPKTEPRFPAWWHRMYRTGSGLTVREPNRGDAVKYGEYLATLAGCRDCHTAGRRSPFGQMLYAGGRRFRLGGGTVVSANITPDPHTGIGRWSEGDWLERVYQNRDYVENGSPKVGPENLTVMPWLGLTRLEPADLKAIFAYLRTQKPVYRPIVLHPLE